MENSIFIGNINFNSGPCNFSAEVYQLAKKKEPTFIIKYTNDVTHEIKKVTRFWIQNTRTLNGEYFAEKAGKEIEKIFLSKGLSIF